MIFEFDPQKSASNKIKHGIDFVEAQQLWNGIPVEIPVADSVGKFGEMRYAKIGRIEAKHWTAIITYRGFVVRLISVRGATSAEISRYEQVTATK